MTDKELRDNSLDDNEEFDFFDEEQEEKDQHREEEKGAAQTESPKAFNADSLRSMVESKLNNLDAKQRLIMIAVALSCIFLLIYAFRSDDKPNDIIPATNQSPNIAAEQSSIDVNLSDLDIEDAFQATDTNNATNTQTSGLDSDDKELFSSISELQEELFDEQKDAVGKVEKQAKNLHQSVTKLHTQLEQNGVRTKNNSEVLRDISKSIADVTAVMQGINNTLINLDSKLSQLGSDFVALKRTVTDEDLQITSSATKLNNSTLTYTAPEYVVHAVIPGRAWLKSSEGQIITVTEGDTLDKYGTISIIDAANGVVLTSSGTSFR